MQDNSEFISKQWRDQRRAAGGIEESFGLNRALEYIVRGKLLSFLARATDLAQWVLDAGDAATHSLNELVWEPGTASCARAA